VPAIVVAAVDAPASTLVEDRLRRLRRLAEDDPTAAQAEAWAWFVEVGQRVGRHRREALAELAELFRAGRPSLGIDGPTEGRLVTFTIHPVVDRAIAAVTQAWMPWLGKTFDRPAQAGGNLLLRSARWPAKLLWPAYTMRDAALGLAAFTFRTRVEAGAVDADTQVLVIDYAVVDANPRLLIKQIRDELVEVVPGAHLGKMLWRHPSERHTLLAYFALQSAVARERVPS
jgi:hypothetical protein